jgi:hypothetical protein
MQHHLTARFCASRLYETEVARRYLRLDSEFELAQPSLLAPLAQQFTNWTRTLPVSRRLLPISMIAAADVSSTLHMLYMLYTLHFALYLFLRQDCVRLPVHSRHIHLTLSRVLPILTLSPLPRR